MIRWTFVVALVGLVGDQCQAFGKRGGKRCGGCSGYSSSSYSGCCGSGYASGYGCQGSHYGGGGGYGCTGSYGQGAYRGGQYGYSSGQAIYNQPAYGGQVQSGTATVQSDSTTMQGYPVQQQQ